MRGIGVLSVNQGADRDRFYFTKPNDGVDTIADFSTPLDTIVVSVRGFKGGLKVGRAIKKSQLRIGAEATDNSDRLIYNNRTGNLFFDVDGIGGAGQIHLAKPSLGLPITYLDIVVN